MPNYTIIVDCTQDISKIEQMSITVCFVQICNNDNVTEVIICEYFLAFILVEKTTGEVITEYIVEFLQKHRIPLENMRGQGYDNGSNMKGREAGVQ